MISSTIAVVPRVFRKVLAPPAGRQLGMIVRTIKATRAPMANFCFEVRADTSSTSMPFCSRLISGRRKKRQKQPVNNCGAGAEYQAEYQILNVIVAGVSIVGSVEHETEVGYNAGLEEAAPERRER